MICSRCGREFHLPPALSRLDNHTLICSRCGTREALEDAGFKTEKIEDVLKAMYDEEVE